MLGEMIGEERGKITGQRVLSDGKFEVTFQASGKIFGLDETNIGTYSSKMMSDGTLYGKGQGALMTADGQMASWKGSGVGKFTGKGAGVSFRGAIYYRTNSPKLARLNGLAVVFEYETDEAAKTHNKSWEWK